MKTSTWKAAVTASFNAAAEDYDHYASVQRFVAQALVEDILPLREALTTRRILEIGCGTGDLSARLFSPFAGASWVISDVAAKMLAKAQANHDYLLSQGKPCPKERFYCCLDGEAISESIPTRMTAVEARFDLIVSNLAFQWFENLPKAVENLRNLLHPRGHLVFSTLGDGTFSQWYQALAHVGYATRGQDYASAVAMQQALEQQALGEGGSFRQETVKEFYPTARIFLRTLSGLGAGRLKEGNPPPSTCQLRRAMRAMADAADQKLLKDQGLCKEGVAVDYSLFYVVCSA